MNLDIPDFLKRPRGQKPPVFRRPKWKRLPPPQRPEGALWERAERWEVHVPAPWSDRQGGLGSGTRRIWVVEGRKWAHLRDSESYVIKVRVSEWSRAAKRGRKIS